MSKQGNSASISLPICLECGFKMPIPRKENLKRPSNHIKTMNCPICKKKTDFIENVNLSILHDENIKGFLIRNNLVYHDQCDTYVQRKI